MQFDSMTIVRRITLAIAVCLALVGLSACGSDTRTDIASTNDEPATEQTSGDGDEDHDDDHADDDHDDDHADDDHGDDDHGDEDHDDHGDGAASGLGAHVHGEAELFVAWTEGDVVVDLISPTDNIFGFEYEPTSDDDIALASERTNALIGADILVFNPQAECSLVGNPETETMFEGSHAELTASWVFECNKPDQIAELETEALFREFPGFVDIDAQWASDDLQSAAELSASSTILRFE